MDHEIQKLGNIDGVLWQTKIFGATIPHDKVYGLLSLTSSSDSRHITVDYVCHVRSYPLKSHSKEFFGESYLKRFPTLAHRQALLFLCHLRLQIGPWVLISLIERRH